MAELSWNNGKLLVNGLGSRPGLGDSSSAAVGTLESIVWNQSVSVTDALLPCAASSPNDDEEKGVRGSARAKKKEGRHVRKVDTCEKGSCRFGAAATASFCSLEDRYESEGCLTRSHGDACNKEEKRKRRAASSLLTKRSTAAATHNQSEGKRREMINEKMKILQQMVPNSSKTDKSSILDEVIDSIRQHQAQVQMMMISTMSIPSMMMPYAISQHPLHMPMMPPMGIAMNMNMAHQNLANLKAPLVNPSAGFMPMMAKTDHLAPSLAPANFNDPFLYLAQSQSQYTDVNGSLSQNVAMMQLQQQQQQLDCIKK